MRANNENENQSLFFFNALLPFNAGQLVLRHIGLTPE
jgi:hypothetical protein